MILVQLMKHDAIDQIYGDAFLGVPMEPEETWPRFDVMLRNGQQISGVPGQYELAVQLFEMNDPDKAPAIHDVLKLLCRRISDPDTRIEALKSAIPRV